MKTFSAQSGWRRFPHVVACTLLLLAAGCGGGDDDLGDQSAANGVWTGTIGSTRVTAVLADGGLIAFSDDTGGQNPFLWAGEYQVGEGDVSLSGGEIARANLVTEAEPDISALRVALSGASASRMLTGTLGADAVSLAYAENAGGASNLSLLDATWNDANTWTSDVGDGTTSMTISSGALTGMTTNNGCTYTGTVLAGVFVNLYLAVVLVESCYNPIIDGEYAGFAFLSDSDQGQDDVLTVMVWREEPSSFNLWVMERQ